MLSKVSFDTITTEFGLDDIIPPPLSYSYPPDAPDIENTLSKTTSFRMKPKRDLSWKNINFKVKDKTILQECWGTVSLFSLWRRSYQILISYHIMQFLIYRYQQVRCVQLWGLQEPVNLP